MAQQHEWMTDGISLDASEKILAEYESKGWEVVSISWDSRAGVFMGVWKRPMPEDVAAEDVAAEDVAAEDVARKALEEIADSLNIDHLGLDSADVAEMISAKMNRG